MDIIEIQSPITEIQIVMLQLFVHETLGLKVTNLHLPLFLTLRFNYELGENQVHQ